jgi:hypothetical protein
MQEHPDARSYRVKTLPSYHKLCVIFGEEHSDGRYSRLARSADPSGEVPVSMTGMCFTVTPDSGQQPKVLS